jgi:sugar-specific transcriptional regulator TrmB
VSVSVQEQLRELGFSRYEIACYLALVAQHPANGSQISRHSGVARSKVYDVLRNMAARGLVGEVGNGMYVPLPPEELVKRLRQQFEANVSLLREQISRSASTADHEHLWVIRGYSQIITKARGMINSSQDEVYLRLFPPEGKLLDLDLKNAESRGVKIRYISLGSPPSKFKIQVVHPEYEKVEQNLGGRSLDLVADQSEALTGLIQDMPEDEVTVNWTRNRWFITASRDSMRHDFYHYLFYKIHEDKKRLTKEDRAVYELIKNE